VTYGQARPLVIRLVCGPPISTTSAIDRLNACCSQFSLATKAFTLAGGDQEAGSRTDCWCWWRDAGWLQCENISNVHKVRPSTADRISVLVRSTRLAACTHLIRMVTGLMRTCWDHVRPLQLSPWTLALTVALTVGYMALARVLARLAWYGTSIPKAAHGVTVRPHTITCKRLTNILHILDSITHMS
jgi:hypothetical protein